MFTNTSLTHPKSRQCVWELSLESRLPGLLSPQPVEVQRVGTLRQPELGLLTSFHIVLEEGEWGVGSEEVEGVGGESEKE